MTDFITYRETVEFTVRLPRTDEEADEMYDQEDRRDVKVISREEIGRRHEPDYVLDTNLEAERYYLLKDGVRIFDSRSHDAILEHAASLGEDVSGIMRFGDLEDPDKSWRIIRPTTNPSTHP